MRQEPIPVPIAVRVYPESRDQQRHARSLKKWRRPDAMFVFDTETRTDPTQRLTFGSYRFLVAGKCLEEGLFFSEDLPPQDLATLRDYVKKNRAVTDGVGKLQLLTRREFVNKLFAAVYKGRALSVGFNLPFDLSRIARGCTTARGRFAGGFALELWTYIDKAGRERVNPHRPRIGIKQIDSKRALKGFTARKDPDQTDLIPENSESGKPKPGYIFRGHFLDLRTLAFSLTDRGYTLEGACEAFGVEHGKQSVRKHGIITKQYIDYNRRDVLATSELAVKLLEEYDKHPIALQPTKAYSPASIGKAYLRAMGIEPILERQPTFPTEYLGYAQSAFFGGRTSAHIRKVPVPVVYTDFLSMYPTVNQLMGLWAFVVAKRIHLVKHCRKEVQEFLNHLTADGLFNPATWKHLTAFVQIVPEGDILPSRAKYSTESNDWQVGVNHLYADAHTPLWFSLPDVVASVILTGRVPKVIDAFRIEARGISADLRPVELRGAIAVDPKAEDFFKVVIEERERLKGRSGLDRIEKDRLDKALKVLANATSYGIYAEMNRQESDHKTHVTCHGIDPDPFKCRVAHPDQVGEFCFPPLASLITGAARLMLALLEYCVRELGGTYAMEDTDSMAIVATQRGGEIPCSGGRVKALSWEQAQKIAQRFKSLSPYDPTAIPGSILKIEADNFDPTTGRQRQIYCLAISVKRYALFLIEKGRPALLRKDANNKENQWSEHGLGHLLNPTDPESDDREWIAQVWHAIILKALDLPRKNLGFEEAPAVGRITVSSPAVLAPLANLNRSKRYPDQIKPFNFLLSCHVRQLGQPIGADPERFHLVGSYEIDPREWPKREWIDQYSGKPYHITTTYPHGSRRAARVKTYGDIGVEYEFHPESKCADADGKPRGKQTVGLLQRRHIRVDQIKYIGKESNSLEEVDQGLVHSAQNVYTEYLDPRRDEWQRKIVPTLRKMPLKRLEKMSGLSRRALIYARVGRRRPHKKHQQILAAIASKFDQKTRDLERNKENAIQKPGR
jgi:hypothetical protein